MAAPAGLITALRTLRLTAAAGGFVSRCEHPAWGGAPARTLKLSTAFFAGHNKWSKVKNIKGPKDEARGRIFMKFAMMIRIAVKEGGSNPDMNINLAQIVEQCRNKNMPKASIEAAIKNAERAKPASQHMFEARGPGGCMLLIEVLTDNNSRSYQDVKRVLNKYKGVLSDGVRHIFSRRGIVVVQRDVVVTLERALELAIEAGAEDVQEIEDEEEMPLLKFICDTADLMKVRASLEAMGLQVSSAGVEFVPRVLLPLDQDLLDSASTLINALSDLSDVVRVWDNIQPQS